MSGKRYFQIAIGGFLIARLAASSFADDRLEAAQARYAASDEHILQRTVQERDRLIANCKSSLDAAAREIQRQGRLDDFLAIQRESERLDIERTAPAPSAENLPREVIPLLNTLRDQVERIAKRELQERSELAKSYHAALDQRVRQLTAEGQIQAAQEVNEARKRVESILAELAALMPAAPPPAPAADAAAVAPAAASPAPLPDLAADPKRRGPLRPPEKGLDLCLSFEKGVGDHVKCPTISWDKTEIIPDGRFGHGCRFAGEGKIAIQSIEIPDEGSWCIWVRIPESADTIQQRAILDANGMAFSVENRQLRCAFSDGDSSLVGEFTPVRDRWTHLALTWGAGERRFYVDGQLVSGVSFSGKPIAPQRVLHVGSRWTGAGRHFMGDVDELLIYKRCLSPEEIALVSAREDVVAAISRSSP